MHECISLRLLSEGCVPIMRELQRVILRLYQDSCSMLSQMYLHCLQMLLQFSAAVFGAAMTPSISSSILPCWQGL